MKITTEKHYKNKLRLVLVKDSQCYGCYFHNESTAGCNKKKPRYQCSEIIPVDGDEEFNETKYYIWEIMKAVNKKIKII